MKYSATMLLATLSAIFVTLPAHAQQPISSASGATSNHIDTLFEPNKVEAFIDVAFDNKAKAYSQFASLFNLCQKQPKHEKCGEEYQQLELQYHVAKSTHEALVMAWTAEFKTLQMPTIGKLQLASELTNLGYIAPSDQALTDEELLGGLNGWLDTHDFANTDDIYLLHGFLVSTDAIVSAQQSSSN